MVSRLLSAWNSPGFRATRKTCGLALIMAATAGAVFAGPPPPIPEIDPNSAGAGLILLTGGFLLIVDRYCRKPQTTQE